MFLSLLLPAAVTLSLQTPAPSSTVTSPPKIVMVTVEGCASGLELKSARPATIEEAELIVSPIYRLKGTKAIKADIKKLSGTMVRVRAELPDPPGRAATGVKVGNAVVSLGTEDDPVSPKPGRMPEPPALEVQSITSLDQKCQP